MSHHQKSKLIIFFMTSTPSVIQPMQHTNCASWEAQWLDLDGKHHAMPGREGQGEDEGLEEFLERMAGEGDEPAGEE